MAVEKGKGTSPAPSQLPSTQKTPTPDNYPYSITEELLEENLRKPRYGRIYTQVFAGFLACLSSLSFGTTLGWSHSITSSLEVAHKMKSRDFGLLVSIALLGCSFGVTSGTFLMSHMGPKRVIQVIGPLFIANWWLLLIPSQSTQTFIRFCLGFLAMSHTTAGETLLFHTVHYGIRRYVLVVLRSNMVMGVLVVRVVATATSKFWTTVMCAIIPVVHYVLIQVVPESPVHLYARSPVVAAKSLAWYRGEDNIYMDMANIRKDYDASRLDADTYRYMMFSKVVYKGILIVLGVTFFQVTAGYFIFMFYSMTVWASDTVVINPVADSSIIGGCFVVTKLFWGFLHAKCSNWKVRKILISSCFFSALMQSLIAVYLLCEYLEFQVIINNFYWTPMVFLCIFLFFYDMGLNHYTKVLIFQYMPFQMYRRANSIVHTVLWLLAFINIFIFAIAIDLKQDFIIFGALSLLTFLGAWFCYYFVVEPTGKSLIQVQLDIGGNPIGTRGALYNQVKQSLSE